jgi:ankyrin repeat protein
MEEYANANKRIKRAPQKKPMKTVKPSEKTVHYTKDGRPIIVQYKRAKAVGAVSARGGLVTVKPITLPAKFWTKAGRDQMEIAKYLVEKGADINAQDRDGYTALMFAVKDRQLEMARFLIANGTDVVAKTAKGATVLDMVYPKDREMLELLRAQSSKAP